MSRKAKVGRGTRETNIEIELNLDGTGKAEVKTGIGFFDHMLETFAKHGLFDLKIQAKGDLHVDQHHTVEDVGITLGQAFSEALGEKTGIYRFGFYHGHFVAPMDEALAIAAIDLSGRSNLIFKAKFKNKKNGEMPNDLWEDFFKGFSDGAKATLHLKIETGRSDHHKIEALFKAFAKALRMAVEKDGRNKNMIPSTKGII